MSGNKSEYTILAFVGPSGAGKDTISNELCKYYPQYFKKIIPTTTRPKRDYEVDGKDYYFTTNENFAEQVLSDMILEAASFNGWFYGTSTAALSNKKVNVGAFSPKSIYILQDLNYVELYPILLNCPDKERMFRLLNREEEPNVNEIVRRWGTDDKDIKEFREEAYEYYALENSELTPAMKDCGTPSTGLNLLLKALLNIDLVADPGRMK